jgi:hypothetical protein
MKFCPVVPEVCRGQVHGARKERRITRTRRRIIIIIILANENPNFMQFSSERKLIYLLNPTTTSHVKIIGFYIIKSLELRREVS